MKKMFKWCLFVTLFMFSLHVSPQPDFAQENNQKESPKASEEPLRNGLIGQYLANRNSTNLKLTAPSKGVYNDGAEYSSSHKALSKRSPASPTPRAIEESTVKIAFSNYKLLEIRNRWSVKLEGILFRNVRSFLGSNLPESFSVKVYEKVSNKPRTRYATRKANNYERDGSLIINISEYMGELIQIRNYPEITITANMQDGRQIEVFNDVIRP